MLAAYSNPYKVFENMKNRFLGGSAAVAAFRFTSVQEGSAFFYLIVNCCYLFLITFIFVTRKNRISKYKT